MLKGSIKSFFGVIREAAGREFSGT